MESNLNSKFGASKLSHLSEIDRSDLLEVKERGEKTLNNYVVG